MPHLSIDLFGGSVTALDDAETGDEVKLVDVWQAQADFIEASVHPDDLARFQAIRKRPIDSLSPSDLRRLYSYLWEVHTGRPTKSAEASSPGPEKQRSLIEGRVWTAGGRPAELTIQGFCDAAYAIILDEHIRGGASLEEALTRLNDWAVGVTRTREEREAEMIAVRNTQHMASLGIDLEGVLAE